MATTHNGCLLCAATIFILLLLGPASGQPPPPQERLTSPADWNALKSLRSSLGIRSRDWPLKVDPCTFWPGVSCTAGRVTGLNLSALRRSRQGSLSPSFNVDGLRNLTAIRSFNTSGFRLPGSIPDWFGSGGLPLTLAFLDLSHSTVSGAIPASLGGLPAGMKVLSLAGNLLAGSIPPSLGQLRLLQVLDLSSNRLSGTIPDSFGSLLNLTSLDLSGNYLGGQFPPSLGSLRGLKTLALSNNMLSGPIPLSLANLSALATLDLQFNALTGSILPDLFRGMRSLENLLLTNCSFTGNLSGDLFTSLTSLRVLALPNNNFSGELPVSLWTLPGLRSLNLSYNSLTGTLSSDIASANFTGTAIDLSHNFFYGNLPVGAGELARKARSLVLSFNYFEGRPPAPLDGGGFNTSIAFNCLRNATANQRSPDDCAKFYSDRGLLYDGFDSQKPAEPDASSGNKSRRRLVYILVGVFGGLILFIVLGILVFVTCLRKRLVVAAQNGGETPNSNRRTAATAVARSGPRVRSVNMSAVGDAYSYDQLLRATSDFSETNLLKRGHSGELYYGVLERGLPVVVKRVDVTVHKPEAFMAELDMFSHASHTRLVPFLGHCMEHEKEKLLVYKYMPNRDLASSLYRKSGDGDDESIKSLDWITRLKIAIGVAEALCYLHHEHVPPIVHRDIKASSILLDDKFEVRLGSLSEACIQDDTRQNIISRFLRSGTSHRASEPGTSGSHTMTCSYDVYCLGRVLLELVTGNLDIDGGNDPDSREWLEQTIKCISTSDKDLVSKIVDPSLIVDEDLLEEVWSMAIVAKSCLNPKASKRLSMRNILKALENPLRVTREEGTANSSRLGAASSRGSWNVVFGSWRSSSETASTSGQMKEANGYRRSGGDQSFNQRRPSNEIFPEPTLYHDVEA